MARVSPKTRFSDQTPRLPGLNRAKGVFLWTILSEECVILARITNFIDHGVNEKNGYIHRFINYNNVLDENFRQHKT